MDEVNYASLESQLENALCLCEDTEEMFWLRESDDYESQVKLGNLLSGQYRFREALDAYCAAEKIRADDPMLYIRLGGAYLTLRHFDEAKKAYGQSLFLYGEDKFVTYRSAVEVFLGKRSAEEALIDEFTWKRAMRGCSQHFRLQCILLPLQPAYGIMLVLPSKVQDGFSLTKIGDESTNSEKMEKNIMKKCMLGLLILLTFCLVLGCGRTKEQQESNPVDNQSSSGDASGVSVTPSAQKDKIIKSAAAIKDITVDYGTEKADALAKLPDTAILSCEDGSTVQVEVTSWVLDGTYHAQPQSQTTCIATGTVVIPEGYTYTGTLTVTANVTVCGGDRTMKELATSMSDLKVDYNTSEADAVAQLPGEVLLQTYAGGTVSANVTWERNNGEAYNAAPDSDLMVAYVGTVWLPEGYTYAGTLTVTANVTVCGGDRTMKELATSMSDLKVDYNTSEADAVAQLPDEVSLLTYAEKAVSAKVSWERKSGETYNKTPDSDMTVAYVGTVWLPEGYTYTGALTVTVNITICGGDKIIKELTVPINDLKVDYNTSEADAVAQLPGEALLQTYAEQTVAANVTWERKNGEAYNVAPNSDTTVAYVGTVQLPEGYTYAGTLTVTANITVRGGDKMIKELTAPINDLQVDYNTSEADAMAQLPGEVSLQTFGGRTVSANVTWERKNGETYQETPISATTVAYIGTVQLPEGYTYTDVLNLTADITVRGGDKTIRELTTSMSDLTVDYGTSEENAIAKLPGEVLLQTYDGKTVSANVIWERKNGETYKETPISAAVVGYIGTVQLPEGYAYTGTLTVTTTITVRGGGDRTSTVRNDSTTIKELVTPVGGFAVDYNTSEAAAMKRLPVKVSLETHNGKTVSANVTWKRKGGETYHATPTSTTAVTYVGTVTIPSGYTYTGKLTAETTITVCGGDKTIKELKGPKGGFEVNYGTSEEDAKKRLPGEVRLVSYTNDSLYVSVTWTKKGDEAYNATPISAASVTYIGTVQIPDGYSFDGETTMETMITVLEQGKTATPKYIVPSGECMKIYIESYTGDVAEIRGHLPSKIRLSCEDGSPITVTVEPSDWSSLNLSPSYTGSYFMYTCYYFFNNITLPDGYVFKSQGSAACDIYVKMQDTSKLQEAMEAAEALCNRIETEEAAALAYPDRIYMAPDGTKPSEVSIGVRFIEKSQIESKQKELGDLCKDAQSDYLDNPGKNQAAVDAITKQLKDATTALEKILDNYCRRGTGFTDATIVHNVYEKLKSFEGSSNYVYDPANYPMKLEKPYTLPQYVSVVIDDKGNTADVELEWTVSGDATFTFKETDDNGVKLKAAELTSTATSGDKPGSLSCTVLASGYDFGGKRVTLNKQVASFDNCVVGASISKGVSKYSIPELTSGKESFFKVEVDFKDARDMINIDNDPSQISVTDVSAYSGGTLLADLKVTAASTKLVSPVFEMTTKAAQLPAVIDPTTETEQYVTGKVKLSVPADAITLSSYAVENGWYIPDGGWEFEADVRVYNPALKVKSAQLSTDKSKVTAAFGTAHWSNSCEVRVALVPETAASFDGTATGSSVSPDAVTVAADGEYTADIPASGITAGKYAVWVKVGDGEWQKSTVTYTHSDTTDSGDSGE